MYTNTGACTKKTHTRTHAHTHSSGPRAAEWPDDVSVFLPADDATAPVALMSPGNQGGDLVAVAASIILPCFTNGVHIFTLNTTGTSAILAITGSDGQDPVVNMPVTLLSPGALAVGSTPSSPTPSLFPSPPAPLESPRCTLVHMFEVSEGRRHSEHYGAVISTDDQSNVGGEVHECRECGAIQHPHDYQRHHNCVSTVWCPLICISRSTHTA
jgi:hypothetical protein